MKSRKAMVASVLGLTGLALAGSACGPELADTLAEGRRAFMTATAEARATPTTVPRDPWVLYEITGTADAVSITMVNKTGGIDQGDYVLPFRNVGTFSNDGPFPFISARIIRPTQGVPEIACRIAVIEFTGSMFEIRDSMLKLDDAMQLKGSMLEFSSGSFYIALKVEAEASGFGNTAICLWENADN